MYFCRIYFNINILSMKKTLFLLFIFSSFAVFGQTLTISSTGETGTSGSNWSASGTNPVIITVTNTANINASVITTVVATGNDVKINVTGDIIFQSGITLSSAIGGDGEATLTLIGDFIRTAGASIEATSGKLNVVMIANNNPGNGADGVELGVINTNGGGLWIGGGEGTNFTTWTPYSGAAPILVGTYNASGHSTSNNLAINVQGDINTNGGHLKFVAESALNNSSVNGDIGTTNASQTITTGSGDVTFVQSEAGYKYTGNLILNTTGTLTISPLANYFYNDFATTTPADFTWNGSLSGSTFTGSSSLNGLIINNLSSLGGLVIGKPSSTANITFGSITTIAGPITAYGDDIAVNANLTSTAVGAAALLKGIGSIEVQDNMSIQTNGGDLILWSNSDNLNDGHILTGQNVTLDSRQGIASTGGGHIHIGGGADTNNDGFPDDATAANANFSGGSAYGILFGNAAGSGVQLLSGGGNITLIGGVDGNFNAAANSHGIGFYPGYTINSGAGNITFNGYANSGGATTIGIDLMTFGATNGAQLQLQEILH